MIGAKLRQEKGKIKYEKEFGIDLNRHLDLGPCDAKQNIQFSF